MAYFTSRAQTANDTFDLIDKLTTFCVTTIGWTLHDDQRTVPGGGGTVFGDYVILKSNGESTTEPDFYCRIGQIYGTANRIEVHIFRYWNNGTQTGYDKTWTSDNNKFVDTDDDSTFLYWFYGDLDQFGVVTRIGSAYDYSYCGKFTTAHPTDRTTSTAGVSSGSSVVIAVNDSSIFTVNNYYQIINVNEGPDGDIERVQVTAKDSVGTDITVATLANNHGSGAWIGIDPFPYITTNDSNKGASYDYLGGAPSTSSSVNDFTFSQTQTTAYANTAPDKRQGLYWLWPFSVYSTDNAAYYEFRGTAKTPNLYGTLTAGGIASEDTITVNGVVYDFFTTGKSGTCCKVG